VIRHRLSDRPARPRVGALALIGCILAAIGCGREETAVELEATPVSTPPAFVGRQTCVPCHEAENRLWEGSHHDRAMQEASEQTVLGDFDDAVFTYNGVTSTFFRRNGGFFVRTDGPDGDLQEYEIAYTFGVFPLQQYLIAFPGGRFQALSICWDTRPASEGGQSWFHLYPDEAIDSEDPLHWTGIHQNWNYMCAECHSTQLRKNFDLAEDRFDTTWEEIDVSCEACHGPGSQHLAWAKAAALGNGSRSDNGAMGLAVRLEDPGRGTWLVSPETGSGMRLAPPVETAELDTCARCHSRRSLVSEDYRFGRPILDTHRLALLTEGLYHADGQILEEVYVHGSYLQSRMHSKGVTCSDCHDPHSAELHFPGDAVCYRCHSQVEFATDKHHFHKPGTSGAFCVDCHMPPKNYMVVDPRHDHSLRVPRPDLSLRLGTPNACNECHQDKSVQWSVDWIVKWYGPERRAEWRYGQALQAGREQLPTAERELTRLIRDEEAPAIARATALELLTSVLTPASLGTVEEALGVADPLIRIGALRSVEALPPPERLRLALPLLSDPVRTVRLGAVSALIGVPAEAMSRQQRDLFRSGVEEYRSAQMAVAERAEAHLNLGWLEANLGNLEAAERSYRTALERDPEFVPAYVNLADLYRVQGREAEGERVLREALERNPEVAELHHSLGLLLVRRRQFDRALASLARASELAPADPRFQYVYAVALHDSGDGERALRVLEATHERFPANREVLMGLIGFHREGGSLDKAAEFARRLLALDPTNRDLQNLIAQLEQRAS
jgi:predicted CXXCH cytochrome family protein